MGGFSTELETLEKIGKKYLPKGEENLREARGYLLQCDSESDYAYSGASGADLYSGVAEAFAEVSGDVYDSLTRNWEILDLAAEAIQEIAKRYATLDGQ